MDSYQLTPLGDQALVITLGDSIDPVVNRRLQTLIKKKSARPTYPASWPSSRLIRL